MNPRKISVYCVMFYLKDVPGPKDPMFVFKWMAKQYLRYRYPTGAYICMCDFENMDGAPWLRCMIVKIFILGKMLYRNLICSIQLMIR